MSGARGRHASGVRLAPRGTHFEGTAMNEVVLPKWIQLRTLVGWFLVCFAMLLVVWLSGIVPVFGSHRWIREN